MNSMGEQKNDFFKRKEGLEDKVDISPHGHYDLFQKGNLESCGLGDASESFRERNEKFAESIMAIARDETGLNRLGMVSQSVEKHFSKREMAFLVSNFVLSDITKQVKEDKDGE
jgi:hypothetical protein